MATLIPTSTMFIFLFLVIFPGIAHGEILSNEIRSDARPVIPLHKFGFSQTGRLELYVSSVTLSIDPAKLELSRLGFFLCTRDFWLRLLNETDEHSFNSCPLQSDAVRVVATLDTLADGSTSFNRLYNISTPEQYCLVFSNCLPQLQVSMNVRSTMYNFDGKSNRRDYLSVGKTILPTIYLFFSLIYLSLSGIWIYVLFKKWLTVYGIHFFMLAVVILKALNLLCEAEDKSYVKRTGNAHGWDVLFYIFSFVKGIMLFTLIMLIGTGWSFLKPYLQNKEKKLLMFAIPLQVVANIGQILMDESRPYGQDWSTRKRIFIFVDIFSCFVVLLPIECSLHNLRRAAKTDGKAAVNLRKQTLFLHYYIALVSFMYFTRVFVFGLEEKTSYKHLWTSIMAGESATLAFYVFTGYKFKPEAHNPYFRIDDVEEEEGAAAEQFEMSYTEPSFEN